MRRIEKYDESLTSEVITIAAWIIIVFGIFLAITSIIGAISTIKENFAGLCLVCIKYNFLFLEFINT